VSSTHDDLTVMPCRVSGVWLALRAHDVVEVTGAMVWARLPRARPELPGVLPWRGRAVAVLDLSTLIPEIAPLDPAAPRPRNAICALDGCTVAVPVEAVREARACSGDRITPARGARAAYAASEVRLDEGVAPVLDLGALVERWARRGGDE